MFTKSLLNIPKKRLYLYTNDGVMKKVLLLTTTLKFGGAERLTVDLAKALAGRRQYHPIICSLLTGGELNEELAETNIEHCALKLKNPKNIIRNLFEMRRAIKKIQPDIIHTTQSASDFYGSVAAIGLKIPVISHIHNPDMPQPFSRKIARFLTSLFFINSFIVSEEERTKSLLKMLPSAKKRMHIIHNAVDQKNLSLPVNFEKKSYREKFFIPEGKLVIGAAGRLVWEKGFDLLLHAFKMSLEKNPNLFLVLVGAGPEEEKLKKMAANLNLLDEMVFAGYQKNIAPIMSLFDIFIMSSKMEAFPIVAIEAMHLGLPLIITDRLSSKNIFSPAAIVVPCSIEGLTEGILKLADDEELRKTMAAKSKKMAENEFLIEDYAAKIEKVYDYVLKDK